MTSIRPAVVEKWCCVQPCVQVDAVRVHFEVDAERAVLDVDQYEALDLIATLSIQE